MWYFVRARTQGSTRAIANVYYNLNAGDPTKWTYAPDLEPAGVLGPDLGERERARHLAGDAAQQDQRILGRAGAPAGNARGTTQGITDPAARLAGGDRHRRRQSAARATGDLVVAGDESAAPRRGLRRHVFRLRPPGAPGNPTRDLIRVVRTVRRRLRGQRRHPGPGLPLAGLRSTPIRARISGGRRPSYVTGAHSLKVGYQGNVDDRRSGLVHEQPEPHLPFEQRRAEPAHHDHLALDQRTRARGFDGVVRAGAMDARPPDAAGGAPLRPRAQLVPGPAGRTDAIPADADHVPRDQGRRQLQGHHAEDGRGLRRVRQRQDGAQGQFRASIWRASASRPITPTRIPPLGCRETGLCHGP